MGDLPPEGTLHYSALQGEVDRLKDYFTRENAHPDAVDDSGRTPLVSSWICAHKSGLYRTLLYTTPSPSLYSGMRSVLYSPSNTTIEWRYNGCAAVE